jgi:hypothetical protein
MEQDVFCYSPFNPSSDFSVRNQSLLLQFALMALMEEGKERRSYKAALDEYLCLLPHAFPNMEEAIESLTYRMKKANPDKFLSPRIRREFFRKLKPFFHFCNTDENFWLFLIKHGQYFDSPKNIMALLQELYLEDLSTLSLRMSGHFSARGFAAAARECISLFHSLSHHV